MIFIVRINSQGAIRFLGFLQAQPDIGHITEIHEPDRGFFRYACLHPPIDQTLSKQRFISADEYRVIRIVRQITPAIFIQKQVIAFQQNDPAVYG